MANVSAVFIGLQFIDDVAGGNPKPHFTVTARMMISRYCVSILLLTSTRIYYWKWHSVVVARYLLWRWPSAGDYCGYSKQWLYWYSGVADYYCVCVANTLMATIIDGNIQWWLLQWYQPYDENDVIVPNELIQWWPALLAGRPVTLMTSWYSMILLSGNDVIFQTLLLICSAVWRIIRERPVTDQWTMTVLTFNIDSWQPIISIPMDWYSNQWRMWTVSNEKYSMTYVLTIELLQSVGSIIQWYCSLTWTVTILQTFSGKSYYYLFQPYCNWHYLPFYYSLLVRLFILHDILTIIHLTTIIVHIIACYF